MPPPAAVEAVAERSRARCEPSCHATARAEGGRDGTRRPCSASGSATASSTANAKVASAQRSTEPGPTLRAGTPRPRPGQRREDLSLAACSPRARRSGRERGGERRAGHDPGQRLAWTVSDLINACLKTLIITSGIRFHSSTVRFNEFGARRDLVATNALRNLLAEYGGRGWHGCSLLCVCMFAKRGFRRSLLS